MKIIKKGQKYLCTKDYIMEDGDLAYKKGQVYESVNDGELISILFKDHQMFRDKDFKGHFKRHRNKDINLGGNGIYIQNIPVIFETVKPDSIVESVIKKFKDRSDVGIKKYGTTLAGNNKLTTLQWIDEAQAEAMDFCLYLERLKKEF
jgi:hypothetical protein